MSKKHRKSRGSEAVSSNTGKKTGAAGQEVVNSEAMKEIEKKTKSIFRDIDGIRFLVSLNLAADVLMLIAMAAWVIAVK